MDYLIDMRNQLTDIDNIEEDFPGQRREHRRQIIIEAAVHAADALIMDGSDGSVEETDYLTAAVAHKLSEKTLHISASKLLRKDIHGDQVT